MALTRVQLKRFTAFSDFSLDLSPGINVLVGANGTGKTHLMKVCYAACEASRSDVHFVEKMIRVFQPSGRRPGRLVKRQQGRASAVVEVHRDHPDHPVHRRLAASFSTLVTKATSHKVRVTGVSDWTRNPVESVYIPVKEMLSNAPGFRSLYERREIHFEEVYADLLRRAYLPVLRGPADQQRKNLLGNLEETMDGTVTVRNEEFFLHNPQGNLEFTLLAEGIRKLALLWLLVQNGSLRAGSVLFWDEPDTNLNPKLFGPLMAILLELQRNGVQVFLATHDYVILEELDLQKEKTDAVSFHSLYHQGEDKDVVTCNTADGYLEITPNAIAETFDSLYDREVDRSLRGAMK